MTSQLKNALMKETSPYLLQHADNPVAWFPWGEEALLKAKQENKPILLSIGYSACHWCHVMAHESFEDEATANLMNQLFINIKVDREERPDLDKVYQLAHRLLTQRNGGWPLTMFLTPDDQTPFFGGTYFPQEARHGLPPFKNIIQMVAEFFHNKPTQLQEQNSELKKYLSQTHQTLAFQDNDINELPLRKCLDQLESEFDRVNAGFGSAPKFPHPTSIEFLMRQWGLTKSNESTACLELADATLRAMALGGIYDQLGGGFFRYSVDAEWMIPHFEKMLYDNGQLLGLYAIAWAISRNPLFKQVCIETAEWVAEEMQSPDGGYYSTIDADSEHIEGKYYYWNNKEVRVLLTDDEFSILSAHYGLNSTPNFEGHWHLHIMQSLDELAKSQNMLLERAQGLLQSAKLKLLTYRGTRIKPGRDEKILTSWNGLMVKGMAIAGKHLQRDDFIDSAESALHFIQNNLWINGRLLATSKDDKAHLNAYLDDYVFLIDGILSLLEARWNSQYLQFAQQLMEVVLTHFSMEAGGFYFTSDDHETLMHRPKPLMDEATPAGNAVAAQVFLRLGHLLGEIRYLDAAEHCILSSWQEIEQVPHAHCALLTAVEMFLNPPETVILRGAKNDLLSWLDYFSSRYRPDRMVFAIPADEENLPANIQSYQSPAKGVLAYVCQLGNCLAPIDSIAKYEEL